jgi:hypothetical protein
MEEIGSGLLDNCPQHPMVMSHWERAQASEPSGRQTVPQCVLTELAQREIEIRRQREVLRETAGAWKSEDHPELAQGAEACIRQIRARDTERFEELEQRRDSIER